MNIDFYSQLLCLFSPLLCSPFYPKYSLCRMKHLAWCPCRIMDTLDLLPSFVAVVTTISLVSINSARSRQSYCPSRMFRGPVQYHRQTKPFSFCGPLNLCWKKNTKQSKIVAPVGHVSIRRNVSNMINRLLCCCLRCRRVSFRQNTFTNIGGRLIRMFFGLNIVFNLNCVRFHFHTFAIENSRLQ